MTEIIGYIAAMLTALSIIPQAYDVFKTKNVNGLSYTYFMMLFCGTVLWLAYGILIQSYPVILANAFSSIMVGYIAYQIKEQK